MCFWVDATDGAFENLAPSHFQKLCQCFILSAWNVTDEKLFI